MAALDVRSAIADQMVAKDKVIADQKAAKDKVIAYQMVAIDNLLINAYGTMYKLVVKHTSFDNICYTFSEIEEMLHTKNLQSDLSSVLDYCCTIIYCWYHQREPTPEQGHKLSFPCDFKELLKSDSNPEKWEREKLNYMLGVEVDHRYKDLKGIFYEVQYKGGAVTQKIKDFYLLHFLRNKFTHRSLQFCFSQRLQRIQKSEVLKQLSMEANVLATIEVPPEPWVSDSRENTSDYVSESLLDIHYRCCKFMEEFRDDLLRRLKLAPPRVPFSKTIQFELTQQQLTFTANSKKESQLCCLLHLGCYGLEGDFKQTLDHIRRDS